MSISGWAEGEEEEEVRENEVKPPKRKPSEERRRVSAGPLFAAMRRKSVIVNPLLIK